MVLSWFDVDTVWYVYNLDMFAQRSQSLLLSSVHDQGHRWTGDSIDLNHWCSLEAIDLIKARSPKTSVLVRSMQLLENWQIVVHPHSALYSTCSTLRHDPIILWSTPQTPTHLSYGIGCWQNMQMQGELDKSEHGRSLRGSLPSASNHALSISILRQKMKIMLLALHHEHYRISGATAQ